MTANATAAALLNACEDLLVQARHPSEVSSRRIADRAGTNPAAINYHFGGLEQLFIAVAERTYRRLNAERLALLQKAVDAAHPEPVPADALVRAIIGPSIRWALDPDSAYPVLRHVISNYLGSEKPEMYRAMIDEVEPHRLFISHFLKVAPWLDEAEIGFRISCLLGIRSQLIRHRQRTEALTMGRIDMSDPEALLGHIVSVATPMFRQH